MDTKYGQTDCVQSSPGSHLHLYEVDDLGRSAVVAVMQLKTRRHDLIEPPQQLQQQQQQGQHLN